MCSDFVGCEKCAVLLGDNIIQDDLADEVSAFEKSPGGARIFLKETSDAKRFGVAELRGDRVVNIEEKPSNPKSSYAVTGIYLYDNEVFSIIRALKPSHRNELEITDVNNAYIMKGKLAYSIIKGFWSDAGTVESLQRASYLVREKAEKK
jgi:glucose-1-phosphate thymidylyltransferase